MFIWCYIILALVTWWYIEFYKKMSGKIWQIWIHLKQNVNFVKNFLENSIFKENLMKPFFHIIIVPALSGNSWLICKLRKSHGLRKKQSFVTEILRKISSHYLFVSFCNKYSNLKIRRFEIHSYLSNKCWSDLTAMSLYFWGGEI